MTQTSDKFAAATAAEIDDADIEKDRAALGVWSASRRAGVDLHRHA